MLFLFIFEQSEMIRDRYGLYYGKETVVMKNRNVVVSTLSDEVFEDVVNKLEELGAYIVEKRYDLLYHRYEIYAKMSLRQSYKLRRFVKPHNASMIEVGS